MKILFLSTQEKVAWGGSEVLWRDAARWLLARHHTVFISYLDWGAQTPKALQELVHEGAHLIVRSPRYPRTPAAKVLQRVPGDPFSRTLRKQMRRLARLRPDLVVITSGSSQIWPECREAFGAMGIPYVCLIQAANDRAWYEDPEREDLAETYRSAREVYFVSEGNRALINRQLTLPAEFGRVVSNPFAVPFEPRLAWPMSHGVAQLAFVGRMEPDSKGCDLILEVLAEEPWRSRKFQFTFFGSGPCERGVRQLAQLRNVPNVVFAGQVSTVLDIWKQNQVLVLPSRYEGMPLAIIEAMLCERVCVVTDIAGNAEMIEDGVSGFVAASPSVPHLRETMERAWTAHSRWAEIGKNAGRAARDRVPSDPGATFGAALLGLFKSVDVA